MLPALPAVFCIYLILQLGVLGTPAQASSCCQLESDFVIGGAGLLTRLPPLTVPFS